MTQRASILGTALVASLMLTGCASTMVPFTHEIKTQHELSNDDLKELQFYVSNNVKLRRELHTKTRTIDNGNLKLHAGKSVEEVVIEELTPGVAIAVDDTSIKISFEEGASLNFSLRTGEPQPLVKEPPSLGGFATPPNPFPGDHDQSDEPVIFVDSDLGNFWLDSNDDGLISFRGKTWQAIDDSFRAHLLIDSESLEDVIETETTLRGRRL